VSILQVRLEFLSREGTGSDVRIAGHCRVPVPYCTGGVKLKRQDRRDSKGDPGAKWRQTAAGASQLSHPAPCVPMSRIERENALRRYAEVLRADH
jgi:hypothetical protein